MRGAFGWYDPGDQLILIWRGLKFPLNWETLIHEILHICVGKGCGVDGISLTLEHQVIKHVQSTLFEILHDNFGVGNDD